MGVAVALVIAVLIPFALWLGATSAYDPWRRWRVRAALRQGATWDQAVLASERAAIPSREHFTVYCSDRTGTIAAFERMGGAYSVVRLEPFAEYISRVVPDTYKRFADRAAWSNAVRGFGSQVRCESLRVLFPATQVAHAQLDGSGRVVEVEER